MHPSHHARSNPNKPALIMATSGEVVTFSELEDRARQDEQGVEAALLRVGDRVLINGASGCVGPFAIQIAKSAISQCAQFFDRIAIRLGR